MAQTFPYTGSTIVVGKSEKDKHASTFLSVKGIRNLIDLTCIQSIFQEKSFSHAGLLLQIQS